MMSTPDPATPAPVDPPEPQTPQVQQPAEQQPAEQRPAEQQPAEQRPAAQQPVSQKLDEQPAASSGGCEHCDGSVPHKHSDVPAAVDAEEKRMRAGLRLLAVGVVLGVLVAAALAVLTSGMAAQGVWLVGLPVAALVSGLAGWAVATGISLAVAATGQRTPGRVLAAALITAALAPVTGFLTTTLVEPRNPWLAVTAAAGWAIGAAVLHAVSERELIASLRRPGEFGEATRQAALHGDLGTRRLGWLLHPAGVALWGALGALVPLSVVLTTAVHVTLTMGLAARRQRRR